MKQQIPVKQMIDLVKKNWQEESKPETDVVLALIRFNDIIKNESDKLLKIHDLTPGGFEVLLALRVNDGSTQMTPSELYRSVLITSGGMTKVLITLENQGLIERVPNPDDGRSSLVKITTAGIEKVEEVMPEILKLDQSYFDGLFTNEEIKDFRTIVLDVIARVETSSQSRLR